MLYVIQSLSDPFCPIIRDDPVRPEIPIEQRVNALSNIFLLLDDYAKPRAAVCCHYRDTVPTSTDNLFLPSLELPTIAVFYTIWSYAAGSGRQLIEHARSWIQQHRPEVAKFVTLSPPTDLARRFHLSNGARVLAVNSDTVNYEYTL